MSVLDGLFKTPFTDKQGKISWPWLKWFQEMDMRVRNSLSVLGQIAAGTVIQGRTEGIGTTVLKLNPDGTFTSLDDVHDGVIFGKTEQLALTGGKVDLDKTGVIGAVSTSKIHDTAVTSPKIIQNVMSNYSNNATVDSIDNGVNATVQVYGSTGGPGTSWHQFIGAGIGPEIPAFSGPAAYNTDFNVYYDGAYHISIDGKDTLPDGILFSGALHTVASGGGGGTGGGGGSGGGGGGGGMQRK